MEVVLVVTDDCPSCDKANAIWESECRSRGLDLTVVHADSPQGVRLLAGRNLTAVPAVLVDSQIIAVGLQSPDEVRGLLDRRTTRGDER